MPRLHLHLRFSDGLSEDSEGVDVINLTAAEALARQGLRDIVAECIVSGDPLDVVAIEICDDTGRELTLVTVAAAISSTISVSEESIRRT